MGKPEVFEIPEDMIPTNPIGDTIISTTSISKVLQEGINRAIRNVMTGIESNYSTNSGDKKFKLVRKIVLDNLNDFRRDMIANVITPVYQFANDSIDSLEKRIYELEAENAKLRKDSDG